MPTNAEHPSQTADRSTPKAAASNRVTVPSPHPEYNISVATEQTSPGVWKAVATVTHATDHAVQAVPVPLNDDPFPDASSAQGCAIAAARDWIDKNMPRP
jgi:hypothetical protein